MARVPSYDGGSVQDELAPLPSKQKALTAESFGGDATASNLNRAAQSFEEKIKNDADQVAVLDYTRQLNNDIENTLYNPQTGALNKKGKDAFPVKEQTLEYLAKRSSDLESSLSGGTQKAAARRMYESRVAEISQTLDRHVGSQMLEVDNTNTKAFQDNRIQYAAQNYQDMNAVEKAQEEAHTELISFGRRNGMMGQQEDPTKSEWYKAEGLKLSSGMNLTVLRQFVENDKPEEAREFLAQNEEHFTAEDLRHAHSEVHSGGVKVQSFAKANEIISSSSTLTEAREKLKGITNPELYDATEARVENMFEKKRQAKILDQNNLYEQAFNVGYKNKSTDAIPRSLWNQLDGSFKKKLNDALNDPDNIKPNGKTYIDAKIKAADPKFRKDFLDSNIYAMQPLMTAAEFKDVLSDYTGLKNKDTEKVKKLDNLYTSNQIEKVTLEKMDIDVTKLNPKEANTLSEFRTYVSRQVADRQRELGRELGNAELTEEMEKAVITGNTEKLWWWGVGPKRVFELKGNEKMFQVDYQEIPKDIRSKAEGYLKAKGKPVTPEAVQELYGRYLRKLPNE